ncbi:MAG: tetratricopeptide repeat protein [Candidatus Hodarchaeales archaeon]|jgi:tetratricopeptide (TPR) repeat protein
MFILVLAFILLLGGIFSLTGFQLNSLNPIIILDRILHGELDFSILFDPTGIFFYTVLISISLIIVNLLIISKYYYEILSGERDLPDPFQLNALYDLGLKKYRKKDYQSAIETFNGLLKESEIPDSWRVRLLGLTTKCHVALNEWQLAISRSDELFADLSKLRADYNDYLVRIYCSMKVGNVDKAWKTYKLAIDRFGSTSELLALEKAIKDSENSDTEIINVIGKTSE